MANIRDIAKQAGVSVTTVSRVLNGHPYVREDKKAAVFQAMQELHYRRNINAVHLSKGKTNMIGVVLPTINHPYFGELVDGIAEAAIEHGIQLILFQTNYETHRELEALEQLRGSVVDGIIFCSRAISLDMLTAFKHDGPIVLCEDVEQAYFSSVSICHEKAFRLGLDYLTAKGYKRIGYCIGRKDTANSMKRRKAYEDKMREIGREVREDWIFDRCISIEDGRRVMREYLALPEKPDAFLVSADQTAAGMVHEAKQFQVNIPGDLAILSFDNHPIAELMGISTIEIPTRELGIQAFRTFFKHYNDPDAPIVKQMLPYRLIERTTI